MTDQETIVKLKEYTGDNGFLKSVLNGYNRWGRLTPKQMEAVKKFFTPKKPKGSIEPIKVNIDLVLKRYVARGISEAYGLDKITPITVTISEVNALTVKAVRVKGKMTFTDVGCCRCCGRDLTDWISKASGIGPTCAKHMGIKRPTTQAEIVEFNKNLKERIEEMGEFEFWIPKSHIKDAMGSFKYILEC
jgi:hypothetical protein